MTRDPEIQQTIDDFFDAVHLRKFAQCQHLLQVLKSQAAMSPDLQTWCAYLDGVLAFEIHQDWAKSERIFAELLRAPLEPELQCRVWYALACTLEIQGRWQEAIDADTELWAVADGLGLMLEKIKAWKHMAICYYEGYARQVYDEQSLRLGIHYCEQSLTAIASITEGSTTILWLTGSIWNTLGATYRYLNEWDQAAACYQRDLAICRQLDDQHGIGISSLNLGEIYQHSSQADWQQAQTYYTEALYLLRQYQDRHLEADALQNLGSLYQAMGDLGQALAHYRQAVTVIEDLRTRISATEARTGFFTTMVATYGRLVQLLIETGDLPAAFGMVERARARSFIELLAGQRLGASPQAPTALLAREQTLRDELRTLYQMPDNPAERIAECERSLDATLQEIRLFDAEYADLRTVQPLTPDQVQTRLPAHAALISYCITAERLYAFVVRADRLTVHPLPLQPAELQRAFDAEGNLVRIKPGADGRLHNPWLLERLYGCLIQPLVEQLAGVSTLYLLPSGPLHFVPFHALTYRRGGQMRALLDDYQVVYAPSATVLLEYCQQKRGQATQPLLALGYNGDLRHAEAEAAAIAALTPGSVGLVNAAASQTALFQVANEFQWVHIACHARFNRQTPLMSYLHLADGPLYASDVLRQLRLHAELVTLSACETGRNKVLKGDELIGLVRAFIYAGAPSVVVSLWPVDELSTRMLMEFFYRELLAGQPKAEALRRAQHYLRTLTASQVATILAGYGVADPHEQVQRLIGLTHVPTPVNHAGPTAVPVFAHPYFWAPFVLVGDQL